MYFIQSKNTVSANGGPKSLNMAGFVLHTEEKEKGVALKIFRFSWLSVFQAIFARLLLIGHNVVAVWRVTVAYENPTYWVMLLTNILIMGEGQHVLLKRNGIEFTWWCPAFFFYLTSTLPTVWLLQLNLQYNYIYSLSGQSSTSPYVPLTGMTDNTNFTVSTLSATINVTNVTASPTTTTGPIISYQCGICEDLTFQLKSRCITHLREQHSGVAYKCNKCLKIFRRNDNPHNCRAQKEDFYLFSHSTGLKREEAEAELGRFMENALEKLIKEIRIPQRSTSSQYERKRTLPMPVFAGKIRNNNISPSRKSLSSISSMTSSSSSLDNWTSSSENEKFLREIGEKVELKRKQQQMQEIPFEELEEPDIYLEEPFRNLTNICHTKTGKEKTDEKEKSFGKREIVNLEKKKGEMMEQKLAETEDEGAKKAQGNKENEKCENGKTSRNVQGSISNKEKDKSPLRGENREMKKENVKLMQNKKEKDKDLEQCPGKTENEKSGIHKEERNGQKLIQKKEKGKENGTEKILERVSNEKVRKEKAEKKEKTTPSIEKENLKNNEIGPSSTISKDNNDNSDLMNLNVGGTVFLTTRTTLNKIEKTKLADLNTGKGGNQNPIFFDRDPTHFRVILNYMRDAPEFPIGLLPKGTQELFEILLEARFYNIKGLIQLVEKRLENLRG